MPSLFTPHPIICRTSASKHEGNMAKITMPTGALRDVLPPELRTITLARVEKNNEITHLCDAHIVSAADFLLALQEPNRNPDAIFHEWLQSLSPLYQQGLLPHIYILHVPYYYQLPLGKDHPEQLSDLRPAPCTLAKFRHTLPERYQQYTYYRLERQNHLAPLAEKARIIEADLLFADIPKNTTTAPQMPAKPAQQPTCRAN